MRPAITFQTTYEDWESKVFKEVFTFWQTNSYSRSEMNNICGRVQNIHYGDVLIKYGMILDCAKQQIPYLNNDCSTDNLSPASYVRDGDIVVADTAEDYTSGKVIEVQNVRKALLSGQHTLLCRPNFQFAKRFLGYALNAPSYHNQLLPLITGTKVSSISKSSISKTLIMYPPIPEQQKIADFLSTVDEKIENQQAIIASLEKQKKGFMQKIFSRELRFRDEDGKEYPEWEEKRLGDICTYITKGTTPNGYSDDNEIRFVKIESIVNQNIDNSLCSFIDESVHFGVLKRSILQEGDILFAIAGSLGRLAIVQRHNLPANTNQALAIIRLKSTENTIYVHYSLQSFLMEDYIRTINTIGAQPNISLAQLNNFILPYPYSDEQSKISCFFAVMDLKITIEKQILTHWQNIKKGLLQQIFV